MESALRRAPWIVLLLAAFCPGADYSLYFGGAGGAAEVEEPGFPGELTQLTVSCWVRVLATPRQTMELVSRWSRRSRDDDRGAFSLGLGSRNRIRLTLRNRKGKVKSVRATRGWREEGWHHVAATWDGARIRLYVDGAEAGEAATDGFGGLAETSRPLVIGPLPATSGKKPGVLDAFVSDVGLWSEALAPEVIVAGMSRPARGEEKGLLAFYPLRESSPDVRSFCVVESRSPAVLSAGLARAGWSKVPTPYDRESPWPPFPLFHYDLSAPGKGEAAGDIGAGRVHQLVTDESSERIGVIWQEGARKAVHVTWVDRNLGGHETARLEASDDAWLAAGTTDPRGRLYYLTIQAGPWERVEDQTLAGALIAAESDGKPVARSVVDCGRSGLNVWDFDRGWGASLRHSKGVLGLILARRMYRSDDGLRHQAAIAVTFSAKDLTLLKNHGQTSGHSMGHRLGVGSGGEFLAVDLGDNYPRGVHLHRFTSRGRSSRVVFTYKTRHGTSPFRGSPAYPEISGGGTTFYKWSNDNATYTELGGVVEGRRTYSVIFATDRSREGKVLDNSRAFPGHDDPRDLAMLRVVRDFHRTPQSGSVVSDAVMAPGSHAAAPEAGGFFDFGGRWSAQRVTGVIWLTRYGPTERAHAPRIAKLRDGRVLILWTRSTGNRASFRAMTVSEDGVIVDPPLEVHDDLVPNRNGSLVRLGSNLWFLARSRAGKGLRLCFVRDR